MEMDKEIAMMIVRTTQTKRPKALAVAASLMTTLMVTDLLIV
jgi:hypothetical protein